MKPMQSRPLDLYALFARVWQQGLVPLARRLSVRVTTRGFYVIALWTAWVIVTGFFRLLMTMTAVQAWQGLLTAVDYLTVAITAVLGALLLLDYCRLLIATIPSHRTQAFLSQAFLSMDNLRIHRVLPNNLSVQAMSSVKLILQLPTDRKLPKLTLTLTDTIPIITSCEQLPIMFDTHVLQQGNDDEASEGLQGMAVTYQLFAHERGVARFDGVDMLLQTRLGWLKKYLHIPEYQITGTHEARVLANFADIVQGQLAGVSRQTAVNGMLKQRRRGQGQDFHQIRNYSQGDSIRHLDWKATARYQRLMTREYQDERDQQILFLLDCGQHMRHVQFFDPASNSVTDPITEINHTTINVAKDRQGSHLDQALNAMLLLADVANQQGDATGFISFASSHNKIIPPKKGTQVIGYLLNQSFDLQPSNQVPDYLAVARQVRQLQKKRALIILITNTRQEEATELSEAIRLLSAKHVVMLANLYEQDLADYLTTPPTKLSQALTYHSVQDYLNARERLHAELEQQTHVHCINTPPSQLPKRLIQHYLLIKQRHQL